MLNSIKIELHNQSFIAGFGYEVALRLGSKWNLPGVLDVYEKALRVISIDPEKVKDLDVEKISDDELNAILGRQMFHFENMEIMADVVEAAIMYGSNLQEPPFKRQELLTGLMQNSPAMSEVFMSFIASMPVPKNDNTKKGGKVKARPTRAQKTS